MMANSGGRTPSTTASRLVLVIYLAGLVLIVPSAVWAFSPDTLPSTAIWTNFFQKIREPKSTKIQEEDTDGDGVADVMVYRHQDGFYIDVALKPGPDGMIVDTVILKEDLKDQATWVYGFDKNGDGQIDMLVRGRFAEGKWDQMLYDSDRDSRPDRLQADIDQNGVYDCLGVDIDADGKIDYLYYLDNETGDILNETVGWVTFKEEQRVEALPQLYYSFQPTIEALSNDTPEVVSATWNYGDGAIRNMDSLVPGEHRYAKADTYQVTLDVRFQMPGGERIYKAWYGIELPVEPPPPGPPPLTEMRVKEAINPFYGLCGFVTAKDRPDQGTIAELWAEVALPEGAPVGNALKAGAVAPGDLDLTVYWWNSEEELNAFLKAVEAAEAKPALPGLDTFGPTATPFEIVSKVRGQMTLTGGRRTATFRENAFLVCITTTRTEQELQRWTRALYDILHPPVAAPVETPTE